MPERFGKHDQAEATYVALLKDYPNYDAAADVIYEMAWARKSQKKEAEAVKYYRQVAVDFDDGEWFGRGRGRRCR